MTVTLNIVILVLLGAAIWWLTGYAKRYLRMVDSGFQDHGPSDPQKTKRYLDTISHLIQTGQRDEAIKLCEEFKASGEIDQITLENTLEFLGVKQPERRAATPLQPARRLQAAGRFIEAVAELKTLLEKNPQDTEAAMLLLRIYVQDLHMRAQAEEVLEKLQTQRRVNAGHLDFARRLLNEWSQPPPTTNGESVPAAPESIDDALAKGFVGTATERLENLVRDQPSNFEARLKLIEVQAVYCQNLPRATRLLQELTATPWFTPEQVALATAKLKAWHIEASKPDGVT